MGKASRESPLPPPTYLLLPPSSVPPPSALVRSSTSLVHSLLPHTSCSPLPSLLAAIVIKLFSPPSPAPLLPAYLHSTTRRANVKTCPYVVALVLLFVVDVLPPRVASLLSSSCPRPLLVAPSSPRMWHISIKNVLYFSVVRLGKFY